MLFATHTALAHPPTEEWVTTLVRDQGPSVEVVKRYVDGIFSVDPVQVVLRDAGGFTLDETAFARDVASSCDRRVCTVYRFDGALSVVPAEVFESRGDALVPVQGKLRKVTGALVHLGEHAVGYAVFALPWAAVSWWLGQLRRATRLKRVASLGVILGMLGLWRYTVTALSRLVVVFAAEFGVLLAIVVWLVRRRPSV
ncbi:MAG: hypothetical protein RLZZ450_4 [Pseudomonadota bacterium]